MERGRKKSYKKYIIPAGVVKIVEAICADYERRENTIRQKTRTILGASYDRYIEYNEAIDKALKELEPVLAKTVMLDIRKGNGYLNSEARGFISKDAYYRRKNKFIHDVAKEIFLI